MMGRRHLQPEVSPPTYSETDWSRRESEDEGTLRALEAYLHLVAQVPSCPRLSFLDACSPHPAWEGEVQRGVS